jgi:2-amino-4-hydroxy-6-hydroxymethyldihydropteridine diphosphokinase
MGTIVYLGLGSNLGDRRANLAEAVSRFPEALHLRRASALYETEPWGYTDQPKFLNQVVEAETNLTPTDLLETIKAIEEALGREVNFRYGPRLIDIDILFYNDLVWQTDTLTVPHPNLHERPFVLIPMAELAPDFRHPLLGRSMRELADEAGSAGVRRIKTTQETR